MVAVIKKIWRPDFAWISKTSALQFYQVRITTFVDTRGEISMTQPLIFDWRLDFWNGCSKLRDDNVKTHGFTACSKKCKIFFYASRFSASNLGL